MQQRGPEQEELYSLDLTNRENISKDRRCKNGKHWKHFTSKGKEIVKKQRLKIRKEGTMTNRVKPGRVQVGMGETWSKAGEDSSDYTYVCRHQDRK